MNKVATMEPSARAELFSETAARLGSSSNSNKAFEGRLLFKGGGTSLSGEFLETLRKQCVDVCVPCGAVRCILPLSPELNPGSEEVGPWHIVLRTLSQPLPKV